MVLRRTPSDSFTVHDIDLNLLPALDALLAEGSVTGAARRLGLSTSAMSRTLARLRAVTGDPLLVRAGGGLVPTPRAVALREQVQTVARDALAVLSPQPVEVDLASLQRTFTVQANEGFVALFAASLVAAVTRQAPGVQLRFAPRPAKEARWLREGVLDLEIGVLGEAAPEIRMQSIFHDRFVGAARSGHPLLDGPMTLERYMACRHVVSSRKAVADGPLDRALADLGIRRTISAIVAGFPDALRIARQSDLVAQVPQSFFAAGVSVAAGVVEGLQPFELPIRTPEIVVSAMWHPRLDADPAHRWLRAAFVSVCREALGHR